MKKTDEIAQFLTNKYHIVVVKENGSNCVYLYNEETEKYEKQSGKAVEEIIREYLDTYAKTPDINTKENVKEIKKSITENFGVHRRRCFDRGDNIINFKNGALDLDEMSLKEHSPLNLSAININADWKPDNTETPEFDKLMEDLTAGYDDKEKLKEFLIEFIGTAISCVPGYNAGSMLLFTGANTVGIQTYKDIITTLLGEENVMNIDEENINKRLQEEIILRKRMIFLNNITEKTVLNAVKIKTVRKGEPIEIKISEDGLFTDSVHGIFCGYSDFVPASAININKWFYDRFYIIKSDNTGEKNYEFDKIFAERDAIVFKAVTLLKKKLDEKYKPW